MNYEYIPNELKAIPNWVCWRAIPDANSHSGIRKIPINPITGGQAMSNNSQTWSSYETALKSSVHYDGIGFMFSGSGYFGVDLDDCRDKIDSYLLGDMSGIVAEFILALQTYAEQSQSGNGIHLICRGTLPPGGRRKGKIEMYDSGRFFITTGNAIGDYPYISDCTERIKSLHQKYFGVSAVPAPSEIVRFIYRSYMEGQTTYSIAKALMNRGIPSPSGKEKWHASTIESILKNEKYKGSALLQKSFTTDFLTKKKKVNEGEVPQYYIEESHEPIISPEDFEQVQLEIARRKKLGKQYSGTQLFAAKLVCADCGCFFGSKVWHSTSKYRRVIWQCNNKFKGQQLCSTPHLYEDEVKQRFVNAFSVFFQGKEIVIETVQLLIENLSDTSALDAKIEKTVQEMENTATLNQMHIQNNIVTAKNKEEFDKRHDELVQQYESQKAVYEKLMQKKDDRQNKIKQLQQLVLQLEKADSPIDTFDENLWRTMIDKVTIFHDNKMIFQFLDGTEIEA